MAAVEEATVPTRLLGPIVEQAAKKLDNWRIGVRPKSNDKGVMSMRGADAAFSVWGGGIQDVAKLTGIPLRRLHGIRTQEFANVTLTTADKIITGLDLIYLSHLPASEGGLKEYFDGELEPDEENAEQRTKREANNRYRSEMKKRKKAA